jgi:hypothetical protein
MIPESLCNYCHFGLQFVGMQQIVTISVNLANFDEEKAVPSYGKHSYNYHQKELCMTDTLHVVKIFMNKML